jgi:hypothetical protein
MKSNQRRASKSRKVGYKPSARLKKAIRNRAGGRPAISIENHLKNDLQRFCESQPEKTKGARYASVALLLSSIAELENGAVWTYNYIQCIASGAIKPSKKFVDALHICLKKISHREKRWGYFSRRNAFMAVYERSIVIEAIALQLRTKGYKEITHARYMEIKKKATRRKIK